MNDKEQANDNKRIIDDITYMISDSISLTQSEEAILNKIVNYLQSLTIDLAKIRDLEKNTSKTIIINTTSKVLQIYAIEQKLQYAKFIVLAYYSILITSQSETTEFNKWLLNDNISNQNVFEICTENFSNDFLKLLGKYITIDIAESMLNDRINVFHCAAKINNAYAIIFFNEIFKTNLGINDCINRETKTKVKPLHLACYSGQSKAVDILIDLGSELNSIDSFQMTPLHYAVNSSHLRITKKLILYGADKTIRNKDKRTPYEVALLSNQISICKILESKTIVQRLKCQFEYKSLKNRRKDIMLSIILLLTLITQLVSYCIIRVSGSLEWYCNDSGSGSSSLGHCLINLIFFIIGIILESTIIGFVVLFSQFNNKLPKGIFALEDIEAFDTQPKISLSEMYLINESICVKCRKNKYESTVHCIACDKCIENWDHHCFWLNCCIHQGNKSLFLIFMIIICAMLGIHILNCIFYLIELCSIRSKAFIADVFKLPIESIGVMIILIVLITIISFVLIGLLLICFSIIIPYSKDALSRKKQRKQLFPNNNDKQLKNESLTGSKSDIETNM